MKNCFLLLILAVLQFSLNWRYGSADDCGELVCKISKGDSADDELCISGDNPQERFKVGEGKELISSCSWNMYPGQKIYKLFLTAPEGWVFLLQLNSTRIFVEAKDINQGSLIYNTPGNYNFLVPDHFLSTTKRIRIRLSYPAYQLMYNYTTFSVFVRTVQEIDRWTVNQNQCTIHHNNAWDNNGYEGTYPISTGSLYIMCNKTQPVHQVLITFHYNITNSGVLQVPVDGFIQIIYNNVNPRILIVKKLRMTCDFSNQTSFWIRFDATGDMNLKIYDVVVHSFSYDREDDETTAISITENVSLPSSLSLNSTSVSLPSTPSSATASTANSTSIFTGQAAASIPIFLIPTVSVVAIFLLVFLVVLCICLRKRCHKNQSRGRESAPPDDLASFNNEQHEYCEVRPSVKSPPYTTLSGVTDQSVGQKNYAFVVTGPAMVVADQETVHSDGITAEVNAPTANNKFLSNGPVYTLVDMEKKALDREEKANNARNRGNAYVGNDDKLDFIPLDEYETVTVSPPVSPGASASLRPDSYTLSDYETVSPPMSPAAMAPELERPYDTLQRGPVSRKQTATSSTVDKKAKEEANHDDALNVYNELATPGVALQDSKEGSEAYQHLQRPLSKRPKAGASLPEIPDEGYGRLDLGGSGASNQTDPVTYQVQDSHGPKTTQVDPMYAILEKPAEANVADDDDPEYDLLDACV